MQTADFEIFQGTLEDYSFKACLRSIRHIYGVSLVHVCVKEVDCLIVFPACETRDEPGIIARENFRLANERMQMPCLKQVIIFIYQASVIYFVIYATTYCK